MTDTILYSTGSTGAILTSTTQGVAGAIAGTPTGTGFFHITGGVADGAARAVNLATTDITGVLPMANMASPTGTGPVTVTSGVTNAASAPIQVGGGAAWVTGTLPYGNGGTGLASLGTPGQVLQVNSGGTGLIYGAVVVATGITPGTSGQFLVTNVGATASTWATVTGDAASSVTTAGSLTVTQAQNGAVTFGANSGVNYLGVTFGAGLLFSAAAYAAISQSTPTSDVAPTNMQFLAQSAYAAAASHLTGASLVFTAGAGATTNGTPGSAIIALGAPSGTGSEGFLEITRGGTAQAYIGAAPGSSGATAGLWLGSASPTNINYALSYSSGETNINAPSYVGVVVGGVAAAIFRGYSEVDFVSNVSVGSTSGGSYGGGVGVLFLKNAATAPSSAPTGGCVLGSGSGALGIVDSSGFTTFIGNSAISFGTTTTSPTISQLAVNTSSTNGQALALQAQNATGTTSTGGSLHLVSGTGTTAAGTIYLQSGATSIMQLTPTAAKLLLPLGGLASTPFAFVQQSLAVSGTNGTFTIGSAIAPLVIASGSITTGCTINFGGVVGFFLLDISGITGTGLTITLKNGTSTTISIVINSLPTGFYLFPVSCATTSTIACSY
jgi:hypothetical protein